MALLTPPTMPMATPLTLSKLFPKSLNGGIQFSIYQDYFLYSKEYVENILKETKLQVVDFIEYNRYNDDDFNMMFILRRGA
jgi:hypothetical protein